MATIKERLENNVVMVVLGSIITGFIAGFTAHSTLAAMNPPSTQQAPGVDWQKEATDKGWIRHT